MAVIAGIYVVYLLVFQVSKHLEAPLSMYLFAICSLGLSGIAGDLIKEVFARPRPITTYGSEIFVLGQSVTPAIPSGHATKSIALILPFILLAANANNFNRVVKILMIIISLGVCFSRTVLGVHYVSDVVAGIGMAILGLPFTMLFANMILKQTKAEQLPMLSKVWGILLVFLIVIFMVI
jgi:undecaprenyl-diphosphatase